MVGQGVRLTTFELGPEDSALFLEFRKHQEAFRTMLEAGVFHVKQGTALLSFNPDGVLTGVTLTKVAFTLRT